MAISEPGLETSIGFVSRDDGLGVEQSVSALNLYVVVEATAFQRPAYALHSSDSGRTELTETAVSLLE